MLVKNVTDAIRTLCLTVYMRTQMDPTIDRKVDPTIVLLCIRLSACKEILMPGWVKSLLRATLLSEGMTSPLHA